mgnify:CR=1 FL=1
MRSRHSPQHTNCKRKACRNQSHKTGISNPRTHSEANNIRVTENKTKEHIPLTSISATSRDVFTAPKTEPKEQKPISYERIRLFESVETVVEEKTKQEALDENTPKSVPKNPNDQYIRKRMIVAGSSYCESEAFEGLEVGSYFDLEAEPDNPHDSDAIKLVFNGHKIGYIAKSDRLAFVTCLKLGRKIYGVVTEINDGSFPTKYEFETWFNSD